ncbi:hypothetical protein PSV08DRAFT_354750 [Bipolaris maydis]|nr:hypothetical protein PSV08DRAFT_354750 [Bipolaris maydis]
MAISKIIANPFRKNDNRVKRHTHNTKWVADRDKMIRKQTGSKARLEQFSKSPLSRKNQEAFYSSDSEAHTLSLEELQVGIEKTNISDSSITRYRSGKNMYNSRLKGENQAISTAWKSCQQPHSEGILDQYTDQNASSLYQMLPESDSSLHSHRHAVVFSVFPPETTHRYHEKNEKETRNKHARKDVGILQFYAELPTSIEKCMTQSVDVNKPLPPVPRIKPAPKPIRTAGLPSSPQPAAHLKNIKTSSKKPQYKNEASPQWWARPRLKIPQATLKSKISFPDLLIASKSGSITNTSADTVYIPIKHTDALLPPSPSEITFSSKHTVKKIPPSPLHAPAY